MFRRRDDGLIAHAISESAVAAKSANIAMGKVAEAIETASIADLQARDRVDISLAEYNRMRSEINALKFENCRLKELLEKIEFPLDVKILPGSLRTCYNMHPSELKVGVQICFEVDDYSFYHDVMKRNSVVNDFCI